MLPFKGVHLILGNDLARDKVVVSVTVTEKPSSEKSPYPVEKRIPGLYPTCVVTRAMSKMKQTSDEEVTLADTVICQVFEGEQPKPCVSEPIEVFSKISFMRQVEKM